MLILRAQQQAEAFLAQLDVTAPGRCSGLYLVGSAALGDWQDKVSNLDVVVVADDPWRTGEVERAAQHHRALAVGDEAARVLYTTFGDLARPLAEGAGECWEGRRRVDRDELDTPLTRSVLGEDAVAVRGTEWFTVSGADDPDLREWAAGRLAGRWRGWIESSHGPGRLWKRKPLAEDLLEVTRLHVAARRGQVVSKVRSGPLALEDVSTKFERVVADAVGFRRGSRTSMYWGPAERKGHSVELITLLCSGAAAGSGKGS